MLHAFTKLFAGGLLGKVLGVFREFLLAATFGTGNTAGAYRAAQSATLIPTNLFTGNTLNAGFIPLCSHYVKEDRQRAYSLFWSVSVILGVIAVVISSILHIGAEQWVAFLVPGFGDEASAIAIAMTRAMAIGIPFYVQATLLSYLEMAHGAYMASSLRGAFQNMGLILGILLAIALSNPAFIGWGFTSYSVAFATFTLWSVGRRGFLRSPSQLLWREARIVIAEFLRVVRPLLFLPVVVEAAIILERILASLLGVGTVAAIDYAKTISETGVVLLAAPLGLAGLAELGKISIDDMQRQLVRLLRVLVVFLVPCSVFLAVHAEAIVRLIFARGQFGLDSIALTAPVLAGLAVGFWAEVVGYVMLKALNARSRNREVVRIVIASRIVQLLAMATLMRWLGAYAFGLAVSLAGLLTLALSIRRLGVNRPFAGLALPLVFATTGYWLIGRALPDFGVLTIAVAGAVAVLFWGVTFAVVPSLRQIGVEAIQRVLAIKTGMAT